jgi:hypothetical protein
MNQTCVKDRNTTRKRVISEINNCFDKCYTKFQLLTLISKNYNCFDNLLHKATGGPQVIHGFE